MPQLSHYYFLHILSVHVICHSTLYSLATDSMIQESTKLKVLIAGSFWPLKILIQWYTRTADCSITWKVSRGKCTALSYVTCLCSYPHDDQSEVSGMVDRFLLDWTKFSCTSSVFHKLQDLSAKALSLGLLGIWALSIIWYSLNSFWNWIYVSSVEEMGSRVLSWVC
jgi:hypothetical protein